MSNLSSSISSNTIQNNSAPQGSAPSSSADSSLRAIATKASLVITPVMTAASSSGPSVLPPSSSPSVVTPPPGSGASAPPIVNEQIFRTIIQYKVPTTGPNGTQIHKTISIAVTYKGERQADPQYLIDLYHVIYTNTADPTAKAILTSKPFDVVDDGANCVVRMNGKQQITQFLSTLLPENDNNYTAKSYAKNTFKRCAYTPDFEKSLAAGVKASQAALTPSTATQTVSSTKPSSTATSTTNVAGEGSASRTTGPSNGTTPLANPGSTLSKVKRKKRKNEKQESKGPTAQATAATSSARGSADPAQATAQPNPSSSPSAASLSSSGSTATSSHPTETSPNRTNPQAASATQSSSTNSTSSTTPTTNPAATAFTSSSSDSSTHPSSSPLIQKPPLSIVHKTNTCYLADFVQIFVEDHVDKLQTALKNRKSNIQKLIDELRRDPNAANPPFSREIQNLEAEKDDLTLKFQNSNPIKLDDYINDFLESVKTGNVDIHRLYYILFTISERSFPLRNIGDSGDPQAVFNILIPYLYPRSMIGAYATPSPYRIKIDGKKTFDDLLGVTQQRKTSEFHDNLEFNLEASVKEKDDVDFNTLLINPFHEKDFSESHMAETPDELVLNLKRNRLDGKFKGRIKDLDSDIMIGAHRYRLERISCHEGGAHGGHYTALKKIGAKWWLLDDISGNRPYDNPLEAMDRASEQGATFVFRKISQSHLTVA